MSTETGPEVELGRYRHFKGDDYEVVGFSVDSETRERRVLYVPLYETDQTEPFDRLLSMFMETVEYEGERVPRFQRIPEIEEPSRHFNLSDMYAFADLKYLHPAVARRAYHGIGFIYLDQRSEGSEIAHLPHVQIDTISDGFKGWSEAREGAFQDIHLGSLRDFVEAFEDERCQEHTKSARQLFYARLPRLVGKGTIEFYQQFIAHMLDNEG